MRRCVRLRSIVVLLLVASATAGCSAPTAQRSSPPTGLAAAGVSPAATAARASPSPSPTISAATSRYGQIVVDGSGRTLYLFDVESGPQPRCYDACAQAWPPLLTATEPVAGTSLVPTLLSTATRRDGSKQVAYNGHPLYYYAGDRAPGDILCQAAFEFGGGWYVVDLQGDKIRQP